MKAMLLAAGYGKRMLPLTKNTPKPLLKIGDLSLIEHNIMQLKQNAISDIIINIAYLGEQIKQILGRGERYAVRINYSDEKIPLESAGGIIKALPLLGDKPFLVINADILNDYPLKNLQLPSNSLAHLLLVPNPPHNANGDFDLNVQKQLCQRKINNPYTFSGIGIYHPNFFKKAPKGVLKLSTLFKDAIEKKIISAEVYYGFWNDIGTPERLAQAQRRYTKGLKNSE